MFRISRRVHQSLARTFLASVRFRECADLAQIYWNGWKALEELADPKPADTPAFAHQTN